MGFTLSPSTGALNLIGLVPAMSPASVQAVTADAGQSLTVTWSGLLNGFVGTPSPARLYSRATIQVTGILGSGASIGILGSSDGLNWATVSSAPITTSTGLGFFGTLNATPKYLKPSVASGDGTTNLQVTAVLS
jgi:hypothetical protein